MILFLRQILFNIAFIIINLTTVTVLLPFLPCNRPFYMRLMKNYFAAIYWSEKNILGLDYEVRGTEHMPKDSICIVAAKHYSAYETLKLHLLFKDPAIILKQELYDLPLWGWHARKTDMIAINRSNREESVNSIVRGALRMKDLGRTIVIFPQGTRVHIDDTPQNKPYKRGIARMYEATNLPVVPLAMNSGVYWAKNAFFKKPGKVVFEFLPPIPAGLSSDELMTRLQETLEQHSNRLVKEAREKQ